MGGGGGLVAGPWCLAGEDEVGMFINTKEMRGKNGWNMHWHVHLCLCTCVSVYVCASVHVGVCNT